MRIPLKLLFSRNFLYEFKLDLSGLEIKKVCIISFPVTEDVYLFAAPADPLSYSQTHSCRSSVATRLSFWQFFLVWWLPVWNWPIRFSEQACTPDEKSCMFVCQNWKKAGFCANAHESVLAVNKLYSWANSQRGVAELAIAHRKRGRVV